RGCDVDSGAVDQQRTLRHDVKESSLVRVELSNMLACWHHRDHDICAYERVSQLVRGFETQSLGGIATCFGDVEAAYVVAGPEECMGHRAPHAPETDECDGRHD